MTEEKYRQGLVFGRFLYFFAVYTLLIKYILPVGWAASRGEVLTRYIYFWDAWWIAHLAVGFGLTHHRRVWIWAAALSAAEIVSIAAKFAVFLRAPDWDFWHTQWFINKSLMLVFFFILSFWLAQGQVRRLYGKEKR